MGSNSLFILFCSIGIMIMNCNCFVGSFLNAGEADADDEAHDPHDASLFK